MEKEEAHWKSNFQGSECKDILLVPHHDVGNPQTRRIVTTEVVMKLLPTRQPIEHPCPMTCRLKDSNFDAADIHSD